MAIRPKLTLSFDNGPAPGASERILDLLARRGLKATFFLVGEQLAAEGARAVARRAKAEGHRIGNHTMTHGAPLGERPAAEAIGEIEACQAALGELADANRYFRPNGKGRIGPHLLSRAVVAHLSAKGYTLVTWTSVPRDWEEPRRDWTKRALADIAGKPWSLIVLHDPYLADMLDTLPDFLDRVGDAGIEIVPALPSATTPIVAGRVVGPLDHLVSDASERRCAS